MSPPDMINEWDMVGRIAFAAFLSSLIGFEREAKNKPANVRMHILVGSGAATFVGVALLNTHNWQLGDVNRVPAGVASGVGFLGAGTIFKMNDQVRGLTTAAGVWIVAAIGYAVAAGYFILGGLVTVLVLVVQFGFLFFLSPRFWRDLKEKFRLSYEMELTMDELEETQSILNASSAGVHGSMLHSNEEMSPEEVEGGHSILPASSTGDKGLTRATKENSKSSSRESRITNIDDFAEQQAAHSDK